MEIKTRASNVPGVEVEAFRAAMHSRRQHGVLINSRGGVVHRPHRLTLEILPADDRQLAAVYLTNNAGDMDSVGLAFNLLRKVGPILDATQGREIVVSLDAFKQVNKHIAQKCNAVRAAMLSNRAMAALVEQQARELNASLLEDFSKIVSDACARVKRLAPAQRPLRLQAADIVPMLASRPL